jgi:tetratricopeptide (TPR) repeat protein
MAAGGDALRIQGMASPMKLARDDWAELLRLLDRALELPASERAGWLEGLAPPQARLKAPLQRLLEQRGAIETGDFLGAGARLPAADPEERFAGGGRIGPYRLERPLGQGGMAVVWLARRDDALFERPVALKLPLLVGRPRAFAERFDRERRILSALAHPHIAALLDAGVDGAQPWLALEYVQGQPITVHCSDRGLDTAARLRVFVQVLRALQYAHGQLVIHRDLKPSNVLVDAQGMAKLLDFGVAKLLQPDGSSEETMLTQLGGRALTPQYASPEQVAGRPLGTASDVYAAGVLLYELLTGRLPYRPQRATAAALEAEILGAHIVPPSRATADRAAARALAGDIDAIVQKALAHEPADRYASAAAFADDIEHHLARRPIAARAPSHWYVASRFVRRHGVAFGAAAAVLVALAGGLATTTWQMQRAEREAQRARAIKDFLVSVFSASDPRKPGDRPPGQITARELLDRSVDRIEREFAGDPPTMIELLGVTGEIYGYLQDESRFEQLWKRRIELARREYGERHPIVVQARIVDVWSSLWHREYAAAAAHLAQIDALIGATRGTRSLEAAEWWMARAVSLDVTPGAGPRRVEALERALDLFGSLDPRNGSVVAVLGNLGNEHLRAERFETARERLQQAVQTFGNSRQGDVGDVAVIEQKLVRVHFQLGDAAAAEQAARDTLSKARRMPGAVGHWNSAEAYGTLLHKRGERESAHAVFAEALATRPPAMSPMGREAALQRGWGAALLAEGRPREALPVLQAAWEAAQARPGAEEDPRRAALLLARAHAALGDGGQARPLFERALDDYARHAPRLQEACDARVHWGDFLAAQGDAASAHAEYLAVLEVAGTRLFEAVPRARLGLASLAAAQGRLDEAWAAAEQARAEAERMTAGHDARLHDAVWRLLAQLALQRGDAAAAAQWAEKALAASERHDGPDAPSVRRARELLATARPPPGS